MLRNSKMMARAGHYRRSGNVLVMVISMLVMLFVFGTTFLLTARFDKIVARDEAKITGGGAAAGNSQAAKVAALISADIRRQLRDDLVGGTGLPYDGKNLKSDVTKDFGDAPGVDGLLAALEPHFDNTLGDSVWYRMTAPHDNLDLLKQGNNQNYPVGTSEATLTNVPLNVALDPGLLPDVSWPGVYNMQYEWWIEQGANSGVTVPDAEGDGMPSSMIWSSIDRPDDLNTPQDEALVLDEAVTAMGSYGSRYDAAVRAIPNGAMVTVYHEQTPDGTYQQTPDALVAVVRQPGDPNLNTIAANETIDPLAEEPVLRNRFFLPRDFTDPQNRPSFLEQLWPDTLLPASLQFSTPNGPRYRSWPIDYAPFTLTAAAFTSELQWWENHLFPLDGVGALNPSYDHRHLITTISYDDIYRRRVKATDEYKQVMQAGALPATPVPLSLILNHYPNFAPNFNTPNSAAKGNVMFSLRGLYNVNTPAPGIRDPVKGQQLTYLYAYFRAMLENVDNKVPLQNGSQRNKRAAALAINTWDYFDSDQVPTFSDEIYGIEGDYTYTGQSPVLGIEGQPFITEAYVNDSDTGTAGFEQYAVELFNPWPYDIILVGDGTLANSEWGFSNGAGGAIFPLAETITIPAATTVGLVNIGTRNVAILSNVAGVSAIAAQSGLDIQNQPGLNSLDGPSGRVALHRKVLTNWIKVDQIDASNATEDSVTSWPLNPATDVGASASLQRELFSESGMTRSTWRFCVGAEKESGTETLGAANLVTRGNVAGIPLVWNDTGMPEKAFPTTGSLLLVAAAANEGGKAFSEVVLDDPDRVDQIDNGHMPIFDQQDDNDPINLRANVWEPWNTTATDYNGEDLPWGQLVYDYFTVLPVEAVTAGNRAKYAGLPLVERVVDGGGNDIYGPRVKGRININAAPWTIMDGIPVLANTSAELPVPELLNLPATIDNPTYGTPAQTLEWFENNGGVWTITPRFAQLIQSYRENRDVEGSQVMGDGVVIARRLGARNGDGLLSVGEMANVILSAGNVFDQGWNTQNPNINYLDAVAPLVRMTDWVTVKSNVFTVYTTIADREEKDGTIRMVQTIDRTNTLYSDELPVVVSESVLKQ